MPTAGPGRDGGRSRRAVEADGGGDLGTQAAIKALEKWANFSVADSAPQE